MTEAGAAMDPRLAPIVKAYDIRGRSPEQLDASHAYALGVGFAEVLGDDAATVAVGYDMRDNSPELAEAFGAGVRSVGGAVVNLGLASTDLLYFVAGDRQVAGAMITASHNPAGYNGIKLCRPGARPIGLETGLRAIALAAAAHLDRPPAAPRADARSDDALAGYARRLHELAPLPAGRRLRVVVDAGNGMAGHTVPTVFADLDVELIALYFELDGTFPHHEANPLDPSTLRDLQAAVVEHGADLGLAFDGDADRCFVIDERGEPVSPSALTCLIAERALREEPGATVLYNVICSAAVPEVIAEHGGHGVRTPVGHSLIKAEMARTGAVFGGEHSGHYYFRDFYLADSGLLAALHVMAALAEGTAPLSSLTSAYRRYAGSGEVNSTVADTASALARVRDTYAGRDDVTLDTLDGLTVTGADWWFNVRASNTEPLLRLNVEADTVARVAAVRDSVLSSIRQEG